MITTRAKYYLARLRAARASGTLRTRVGRKVKGTFYVPSLVLWKYLVLNQADRKLRIATGLADHRRPGSAPSASDRGIAERICAAYRAAKLDEPKATKPYQVRGLWAEMIKVNYGPLIEAVTRSDIESLCRLLDNFSREQFAVGTGAGYDDYVHYQTPLLGGLYIKAVWCEYRDALVESGFDLSKIRFPSVGNPFGVPLNGDIIQIETLRHALYAARISRLLSDQDSPVAVEIGGGFGGQAFQVVTQCRESGRPVGKYLDYDIPEVQIVASYFLLKALPDEVVRLYGEECNTNDFTIGVFPHYAIESLGDLSADLVFNSHSFSEMTSDASRNYLSVCNRICRKYFLHVNHETRFAYKEADGTVTRNLLGSQMVPDPGLFKHIYRFPRVVQRPEDRFDTSFEYLYERRRGTCHLRETPVSEACPAVCRRPASGSMARSSQPERELSFTDARGRCPIASEGEIGSAARLRTYFRGRP